MSEFKRGDIVIWDDKSKFAKDSGIRSSRSYSILEDCFGLYVSEPFMDNLYCLDGFVEINAFVNKEYKLKIGDRVINTLTNEIIIIELFDVHYSPGIVIIHNDKNNISTMVSIKNFITIENYRNNIINDILEL